MNHFDKDELLAIIGWYGTAVTNPELYKNLGDADRSAIQKVRELLRDEPSNAVPGSMVK